MLPSPPSTSASHPGFIPAFHAHHDACDLDCDRRLFVGFFPSGGAGDAVTTGTTSAHRWPAEPSGPVGPRDPKQTNRAVPARAVARPRSLADQRACLCPGQGGSEPDRSAAAGMR
jgi:hypothetical protein